MRVFCVLWPCTYSIVAFLWNPKVGKRAPIVHCRDKTRSLTLRSTRTKEVGLCSGSAQGVHKRTVVVEGCNIEYWARLPQSLARFRDRIAFLRSRCCLDRNVALTFFCRKARVEFCNRNFHPGTMHGRSLPYKLDVMNYDRKQRLADYTRWPAEASCIYT